MSHAESARTVLKDLNILIERSKRDIASVGFTDRIEGMVEDESVFVELTIDSLKRSFENALENMVPKSEEEFKVPEIEEEGEVGEINIEELIAESYNVGKSDEEKSQAIMTDLKEVFKMYAYLFIAIGQQLEIEKLLANSKKGPNEQQNLSPRNNIRQTRP